MKIKFTAFTKNNPSLDGDQNCTQKTDIHWALFYGINGMVYGVPLLTVFLKSKRWTT